jgi:outer membrane protein assembly factor BamB
VRRRGRSLAAAALAAILVSGARAAAPPAWSTYGADPGRAGTAAVSVSPPVRPEFVLPLRGRVTSQVLAARDVPAAGLTTLYVTTSAGLIYAVSERGYVRWRVDLGELPNACPQLDGYGVTGTPVIDAAAGTLYAADALGRLHALALASGAERPGWPVQLYDDPAQELVWGALALAGGRIYAATGSYCDAGPFLGKVIAVDTRSREVSSWVAVPAEQGGGGGIWGWGGVAYSARLDRIFVATGNAFPGASNSGDDFSEAAGYGESVVALSPGLDVLGASHPASISEPRDLDFAGSPVVFDRTGCGEMVVAHDKNAQLFGWRAGDLAAGPLWTIDLERFDPSNPLLSQPAYDPARRAVFVVTGAHLVRVDVAADCSAKLAWSRPLGTGSLNGSPTIAGGTVWYARSDRLALAAADAETGTQVASVQLSGLTVTAPTILDGRIFVGTFTGELVGFAASDAAPVAAGPDSPTVPGHSSWLDAKHAWVSRETGVFATDDGGSHWRRIFPQAAAAVLRTSVRAGIVRLAATAPGCTCATDLWTTDGGRSWHRTRAIAGGIVGRGRSLYWLASGGAQIRQVTPWPPAGTGPIRSRTVAAVDAGRIVSFALVPGGVAGLVKGTSGRAASIVVSRAGRQNEWQDLPEPPGMLIAQSLQSSGAALIVDGTVFDGGVTERVRWSTGAPEAWERLPS